MRPPVLEIYSILASMDHQNRKILIAIFFVVRDMRAYRLSVSQSCKVANLTAIFTTELMIISLDEKRDEQRGWEKWSDKLRWQVPWTAVMAWVAFYSWSLFSVTLNPWPFYVLVGSVKLTMCTWHGLSWHEWHFFTSLVIIYNWSWPWWLR